MQIRVITPEEQRNQLCIKCQVDGVISFHFGGERFQLASVRS